MVSSIKTAAASAAFFACVLLPVNAQGQSQPPASVSAVQTTQNSEEKAAETDKAPEDAGLPKVELNRRLLFQIMASEIALQRNQAGAAFRTFLTVAEETKDPRLAQRAAQIALAGNALKEFRQSSEVWLKLAPTNRNAQNAYLTGNIMAGDFAKLVPVEITFLETSPDVGKDILALQSQLALSKEKNKAIEFFKRVTAKYENRYETKLGLGRLEALNGNFDAALRLTREAYKISQNEETVSALASLLSRSNSKESEKLLAEYLTKNPKSVPVRNTYAQLLIEEGNISGLRRLADNYNGDSDFVLSLASALIELQEYDRAEDILTALLPKIKEDGTESAALSRAKLLLSDIASQQKDYDRAVKLASEVGEPLKAAAALQIANIYAREGRLDGAIKKLGEIQTNNELLLEEKYLLTARIELERNKVRKARAALAEGIVKLPYSKHLNYEAAMLAEQDGDIKTAENYLKKAIEIDPTFANAYNSLGYTLLETSPNRRKDAEKYINRAYELNPSNPFIIDSKGWLAFKQKKYTEAEKLLKQALSLSKQPDIFYHLIELYWARGRKNEAIDLLKNVQELWPENSETEQLMKRLRIPHEPNR